MPVILVVLVVALLILLGPIAVIYSLNVLFPMLLIPYTLETWVAVVVLGSFLKSNYKKA